MTVQHAKILKAWCVELKAEVTINEARREYISQEPTPPRYTFFCNDKACLTLSQKIRVSGVNYTVVAEESPKYKSAHFRLLDDHHPKCLWLKQTDIQADTLEPRQVVLQRDAKRKLTDLVTVFDPRTRHLQHDHAASSSDDHRLNDVTNSASGRAGSRTPRDEKDSEGETRTSDLDRLVDSYIEAKLQLSDEQFKALRLKINGHGECGYDDYFQWVGRSDGSGVIYGGGWVENMGYGFKIFFFDKRNQKEVSLYVSSVQLKNFKYRKYLKQSVDEVLKSKKTKYLKVYCLGRIEPPGQFNSWNIVVENLNHLVLRVISKKSLD